MKMISISNMYDKLQKIKMERTKRIQEASDKREEKACGIGVRLLCDDLCGFMVADPLSKFGRFVTGKKFQNQLSQENLDCLHKETKYCLDVAIGGKNLKHYWGVVREGRNSNHVPYDKYNPVVFDARLRCYPSPILKGVPSKFEYRTISFYYKKGEFTGKSLICDSISLSGQISTAYNQPPSPEILEEAEPLIQALEKRIGRTLIKRRE